MSEIRKENIEMKVTTELKNLIRRSFDEKRANVSNEIKSVAKDLFEEKRNEVISSKEFKVYVKACKALYERFENDYESQGDYYSGDTAYRFKIEGFNDVKVENVITDNSIYYSKYNNDIQNKLGNKIKELDLAQESLMIKLTYEKDLETVRAMLAEYDIVI